MSTTRLCLGTAQIGLDYGVANLRGKPSDRDCERLLSCAIERGILHWDTAPAYGDAEHRIGRFLADCQYRHQVRIVSKLPRPPDGISTAALPRWVSRQTELSLRALGVDRLAGWLVHAPGMLQHYGTALCDAMSAQVARGRRGANRSKRLRR